LMRVRWAVRAAQDLEIIADYLFEKTPENAERLIRRSTKLLPSLRLFQIADAPARSRGHENSSRLGSPYVVVY
jgi:plasmid stabilization system protein ParE